MKSKITLATILISLLVILAPLSSLKADPIPGTLPFGGLVTSVVACTCPGPPVGPPSIGNLWISMAPGFFGSIIPVIGAVVYVPYTSFLYSWYQIGVPGTWHLGSFVPGIQACWMYVPPAPPLVPAGFCYPLPSYGSIVQVGTSKSI